MHVRNFKLQSDDAFHKPQFLLIVVIHRRPALQIGMKMWQGSRLVVLSKVQSIEGLEEYCIVGEIIAKD